MTDAPTGRPLIEAKGIAKSFSGVQALRGIDFSVMPGEIHALLGQNGAGKSTLVKILNGVHPAGSYSGTILLDGEPASFGSPFEARAAGVGYVPQEIEVLEQLSVAENVFAGRTSLGRGVIVDQRELRRRAGELFRQLGLDDINPEALVASLSSAQRHLVMIARALALSPRVLMLDEPTASLSGAEVEGLFAVLRRLKAQGVTMIYITHRLPEVLTICDRATVLRDGQVAAEIARQDFDEERFIFAMSGQRLQRLYPDRAVPPQGEVALELRHVSVEAGGNRHAVHDVGFSIRAGEIVGLAGLLGSGRTEILHAIYGRAPFTGEVLVNGAPVPIRAPVDARRAGIALLTEDRKRDGLLFNLPVGANITIGNLGPLSRGGLVHGERERSAILEGMRGLKVKAASPQGSVAHLSGGNQQKLLFARVLMRAPRVLLLDEPTKGVDAGTRHEIYRLIVELAEQGVALLVVASELEEVIGLCDRCLVVADGRIVDEFDKAVNSEEKILRSIAAAQAQAQHAAS